MTTFGSIALQRRSYSAGATRITVTLARHAMDDAAWDGWVQMSTSGFPQADLELPAAGTCMAGVSTEGGERKLHFVSTQKPPHYFKVTT